MSLSEPEANLATSRRNRRFLLRYFVALVGFILTCFPCASVRATVVERVVAVVGEHAILMSDLRARAVPYLTRIYAEVPAGAQRSAAVSQLYKSLLERMVDEELLARAAQRAHITVTDREVDDGLTRVAQQNNVTVERVLEEAKASGLSEADYRDELRRQILEARVLNLRVQGHVQVRAEDLRAAYRELEFAQRKNLSFEPAWIVIEAEPDQRSSSALAESISKRARAGEPFKRLASQYSDDAKTRAKGGILGKMKPGTLPAAVDRVALELNAGDVSPPIRVGNSYVVLKILWREESSLPTLEEARAELAERVYGEKMNRARARWLQALRRQTHVEVRL